MYDKIKQLIALAPNLQAGLEKTGSDNPEALALLKSEAENTAAAVYTAVRSLYGIGILDWEPDTLRMSFAKDGIELEETEFDKLLAAITLQTVASFYWDNLVFQRTVQSFNSVLYDPESLQEPCVAHMAWAVHEAAIVRGLDPDDTNIPDYDEDVQQFVAVVLKRAGWVYPPEDLSFVEDNLDNMFPAKSNASRLKKEVKEAWDKLDKEALERTEFAEDALGVQLSKLASCYLYVQDQAEKFASEIISLR
jgi:hypothetical protein